MVEARRLELALGLDKHQVFLGDRKRFTAAVVDVRGLVFVGHGITVDTLGSINAS